jgi:hypothetical protein
MKITKSKLRQIIREELLREYDIGDPGFDPRDEESANRLSPEDATRRAKILVQTLDPTALTTVGDPEYREQVKQAGFAAFNPETTSASTVGLYLLTLAAAAPLVGKVIGIPAKAARAALKGGAKSTKAVALADKAVKNASKQPQKVRRAVESAEEVARRESEITSKLARNHPRHAGIIDKSYRSVTHGSKTAQAAPIEMVFDGRHIDVTERITSAHMARSVGGMVDGKPYQHDIVLIKLQDGTEQSFYRRTGHGGDSAGGSAGDWVPFDGLTVGNKYGVDSPIWMNKADFSWAEVPELNRYGTRANQVVGNWLNNATKGVKPGLITNDPIVINGWLQTSKAAEGTRDIHKYATIGIVVPGRDLPIDSLRALGTGRSRVGEKIK